MKKYSYFTVLSNWLIGYDKYKGIYSKEHIKQSSFSNVFYLLEDPSEYHIGIFKAEKLLKKVNIYNNKIIRIDAFIEDFFCS
jgi:hypothetical protein